MADLKKVKERILALAGRPKNVTVSEIESIINLLSKCGFQTATRQNDHSKIFRVKDQIFSVLTHKGGGKQLRECYVKNFLRAMVALELLDEEE